MPTTRTLILMRHAKSAYPGGVRDHDRPLADRGRREAGLAGQWLSARFATIDEVLCSTATRTSETLAATGLVPPVKLSAEIYDATPDEVLKQVRTVADTVRTLLVVGHAPAMPGLAMELAGDGSDTAALDRLRSRFPTAAIAVLESETPWSELDLGDSRLVAFHIPRD
ncbi:phosphohistidine phosphatase [Nakamurella sp. UYEF19]|uniref:SixA phosphatase family protein n=1 Tax=Nakamurella sp. UYEF19 TaxID=1756392 RepID=UPI0033983789